MSAQPVDVHFARWERMAEEGHYADAWACEHDAIIEARAAVAELIAADKEYDEAKRTNPDPTIFSAHVANAVGRRRAALARCGGLP